MRHRVAERERQRQEDIEAETASHSSLPCALGHHRPAFYHTSTGKFLPARRYRSADTSHGPVSICLSVYLSRVETALNESSWFWHEIFLAPILQSYTVLKGNSGISKNKGTFLWNFVSNSGLRENFASAYQSPKRVIDLARERWTLRA